MRTVKICVLTILIGIILGYLLLAASYCIPSERLNENCAESAEIMKAEGVYPVDSYSSRQLDNYTDSLMLLTSAYSGDESIFRKAVDCRYDTVNGDDPYYSFIDIFSDGSRGNGTVEYARYWHGYQVFLRPLLALCNYSSIRLGNTILQSALITLVLAVILRKRPDVLIPFILMLLYLAPTAIGCSLQYSSTYTIMLIALLAILLNPKDMIAGNGILYVFLLAGIATAYFDLLTAPTITLTAPLTMLCALRENPGKTAVFCIIVWFAGYSGMWAGKWIFSIIANGPQYMQSVLLQITHRISDINDVNEQISRLGALKANIAVLFNNRYLNILTICFFAIFAVNQVIDHTKGCLRARLPVLLPAVVSTGWVLVLSNHSAVHSFFTYRTLAPIVFSVLSFFAVSINNSSKCDNGRKTWIL